MSLPATAPDPALPTTALPLDPPADATDALLAAVVAHVRDRQASLPTSAVARPASGSRSEAPDGGGSEDGADLVERLLADRPGAPVPLEDALATFEQVLADSDELAAGGALSYIPGSGLLTAALGELLAASANRYTGLAASAPAAVALEAGVLRVADGAVRLPRRRAGGPAVRRVDGEPHRTRGRPRAARARSTAPRGGLRRRPGPRVGAQGGPAAGAAARARACLPHPSTGSGSTPRAVRVAVKQDRHDGLLPVAIVAAAGTTNTGAVDPLDALADVARDTGTWLHVDGAYGGFFQLTDRGRQHLAGIERADSITLDPHKSLFLPYGTGALVVRDRAALAAAFAEEADYLRDLDDAGPLPELAQLTPELTRDWRGVRLWLPLKLHGLAAFVEALDDKLDLARWAWEALEAIPGVTTRGAPDLSIVVFRVPGDDAAQDRALARINAEGTVRLSSTQLEGQVVLRLAVLSHRTRRHHVERVVAEVAAIAAER
jgi:aromatic-L-amino-acid/L-tryptophan decarboxylase